MNAKTFFVVDIIVTPVAVGLNVWVWTHNLNAGVAAFLTVQTISIGFFREQRQL